MNKKFCQQKLIVILGPTASGKTALSIKLAKKLALHQTESSGAGFNGVEIISADSRQVYKGMNVGSCKITKKEMENIPHYLLDVASPKQKFSVAQYKKLAENAMRKIWQKGKLPFLVGGTGFYIQAITDGIVIPEVKPDWKLRAKLEKKSNRELFSDLFKIDRRRAKTIDRHNRRRLIRALEIVIKSKKPIPSFEANKPDFDILFLGIKKGKEELKKIIEKRLLKRIPGIINEIKKLRKLGVSFKRLEEFGLEYRFGARYLQNKISKQEMIDNIQKETEHYAKNQITWFKRNERIKWIKNPNEAEKLTKSFLN